MRNFKVILVYVAGIAILIATSFVATGQNDGAGFVAPTPVPSPTPVAPAENCTLTPAGSRHGYRSGAPVTTHLRPPPDFQDLGQRLVISGRVFANDCRTPLPNTQIEVWHTNPEGQYDYSDRFILRGQMQTDAAGRYRFATIAPGRYFVRGKLYPAHIHFRVSHPGMTPLYTQLFFSDDPYLKNLSPAAHTYVARLVEKTGANGITWLAQFNLALPVPPPTPSAPSK